MNDRRGLTVDMANYVVTHIRAVLGGIALIGSLVSLLVFAFDIFNIPVVMRLFLSLGIVFVFFMLGAGLSIFYLISRVEDLKSFSGDLDLICLGFAILNGDDGRARDDKHIYDLQERVYDLRGGRAYFKNRFVGHVASGKTSDGIPIKYIGDYGIKSDELPAKVVKHKPLRDGEESVELQPEIIESRTFEILLKIPFGEELQAGEEFDLTFECDDFGRAPDSSVDLTRVHFPMHRFRRLDEFDATIKLPNSIDEYQRGRIALIPDLTPDRNVKADYIHRQLTKDFELIKREHTNHVEFQMHVTQDANSLYLFQFLRR